MWDGLEEDWEIWRRDCKIVDDILKVMREGGSLTRGRLRRLAERFDVDLEVVHSYCSLVRRALVRRFLGKDGFLDLVVGPSPSKILERVCEVKSNGKLC